MPFFKGSGGGIEPKEAKYNTKTKALKGMLVQKGSSDVGMLAMSPVAGEEWVYEAVPPQSHSSTVSFSNKLVRTLLPPPDSTFNCSAKVAP